MAAAAVVVVVVVVVGVVRAEMELEDLGAVSPEHHPPSSLSLSLFPQRLRRHKVTGELRPPKPTPIPPEMAVFLCWERLGQSASPRRALRRLHLLQAPLRPSRLAFWCSGFSC